MAGGEVTAEVGATTGGRGPTSDGVRAEDENGSTVDDGRRTGDALTAGAAVGRAAVAEGVCVGGTGALGATLRWTVSP
ncbi:hypothetical protein [Streptomyces hokutonensis]|uniref:hypothetical protein n=1 Tax=Streptomyces hokutonensis TaxID=1306990 RepID=UPI0003A8DD1E|nr:hypothetical protein [Streptomyces hokutonensis]